MRIQPEWEKKLQQHIITEEMLEAALLSTVMRQANWHEKRMEYSRWRRTVHDYAAKAAACEMEMTVRTRWLLSSQAPLCIHKTFGGCCYRRIRESIRRISNVFIRFPRGKVAYCHSAFP